MVNAALLHGPGTGLPKGSDASSSSGVRVWGLSLLYVKSSPIKKETFKVWSLAPKPRSLLKLAFPWPDFSLAVGLPCCYSSSLTALTIQVTPTRATSWDSDV